MSADYNGIPETDESDLLKQPEDSERFLYKKDCHNRPAIKNYTDYREPYNSIPSAHAVIASASVSKKHMGKVGRDAQQFLKALSTDKAIERLYNTHVLASDTEELNFSPHTVELIKNCRKVVEHIIFAAEDLANEKKLRRGLTEANTKLGYIYSTLLETLESNNGKDDEQNFLKKLLEGIELVRGMWGRYVLSDMIVLNDSINRR